jgi:ketosteroid isomerase-like protein
MEIYAEDAVYRGQDTTTGKWNEFKGLKKIEDYTKERGKGMGKASVSILSIKKEADIAHVEYNILQKGVRGTSMDWEQNCSAELAKIGARWKIKINKVGAH